MIQSNTRELLQPLRAVAFATVSAEGRWIRANAGVAELCEGPPMPGSDATRFFINPSFSALREASATGSGKVFSGIMTLGDPDGRSESLVGTVIRHGDELCVVAEPDIAELRRVSAAMLELNRELADTQHKLLQVNRELRASEARVTELSLTDPLTGAANRRRLTETLAMEAQRSMRFGEPLSVIAADIDHFKSVNDTYGHDAGDEVLKRFVAVMKAGIRPSDLVARSGGEEFILVLPHTAASEAHATAERLRLAFAEGMTAPMALPVTASFGVSQLGRDGSVPELLKRADAALYEAKNSGRNRTVTSPQTVVSAQSVVPSQTAEPSR